MSILKIYQHCLASAICVITNKRPKHKNFGRLLGWHGRTFDGVYPERSRGAQ